MYTKNSQQYMYIKAVLNSALLKNPNLKTQKLHKSQQNTNIICFSVSTADLGIILAICKLAICHL